MNRGRWVKLLGLSLTVLILGCSPSPSGSSPMESTTDSTETLTGQAAPTPSPAENLGQSLPIAAEAEMADQVFQLEVARTPQQQAMGLMYRPALPNNRGMLFAFERPRSAQFWMKNVPVPLDMVFLYEGKVKAIAANVPPCTADPCPTYGPRTLIDQVIELRAGRAAEINLQVGDTVTIRFLDPQGTTPSSASP